LTALDVIHSALSCDAWTLVLLLLIPSSAVSVYGPSSGSTVSRESVVSRSVTSTTSSTLTHPVPQPQSTPRFRNGTWSRQHGIAGTPPNNWWLIDYWNAWNYYGSFTAVANTITGLSFDDDILILPMNLAYGSAASFQWFQFDIDFGGDGSIWWGIWNVDGPADSDSDYHPNTIDLPYVVGHSYRYQGSLVSGRFRFQMWDYSAGTTWQMYFDIPSTSQFYDSSYFSPASVVQGYTTSLTVDNVPYFQFTVGYGMTSFTFGQFGSGIPNGLAINQEDLGDTPRTWHWELIGPSHTRDFRVYSLPMSYLGQEPESVKLNDLHAEIRVDYVYRGQNRSTTLNTYFDLAADIDSSIIFTVAFAPSGWSFGNKWDHYNYSQHDAMTLNITVVSGLEIDEVAAFFNPLPIEITITSSPTGSGFVRADGSAITTPQVFTWLCGSSHTIAANSPVGEGTDVQHVWVSWSDGGAQSHSITVPWNPTTYTATFKKQFILIVSVSPTGAGALSAGTGWQDDGTKLTVTATPNSGYSFYYWSLDGVNQGNNLSILILMNSPHNLTAFFRARASSISVASSPGSITLGASVILSGVITPAHPSPGIPSGTALVLSYSLNESSWASFIMTQTGSVGAYSVVWYPPYPGTYKIKAAWSGNLDYEGSTSSNATLTVTGRLLRMILLISGPTSASRGSLATFDVLVTNPGSSLSSTLYFEVTGPGGYRYFDTQQVTVAAGGRGRFQSVWQVPSTISAGQYQVFVSLIPPKPTAIAQTQITVT